MLTIFDSATGGQTNRGDNSRWGRREFLRVGSLGLAGLGLPRLLSASTLGRLSSASSYGPPLRDRSVILLFLHGGPSQFETFDPKMEAPSGVRSATGEVPTRLPGITFGGTFPRLAQRADRLSLVRSFVTGNGNHDIKPVVSPHTAQASLGSHYARIAGTNHPTTGMPRNVTLFPRAVVPESQPANQNFGRFDSAGDLGAAYAPFVPGGGSHLQEDMQLQLDRRRLTDRRHLLQSLDRLRSQLDQDLAASEIDKMRQQAFDTLLGGVAQAFDLRHERPATLAAYDTGPLLHPESISRKWNNYKNYVDNARSLGKLLLLARRLCEHGCGFVTVTTNFVWDMHADQNNAGVQEGMAYMGHPLDYALSAFLDDVQQRGLQDKILLVAVGEMGRTPKINKNGGRDHWGRLAPLLLSGGGLPMGQVMGQSTRDGGEPASEAYGIENLVATILNQIVDVGVVRTMTELPADVIRVATQGTPIPFA